jgi:1-deoxy-D-xylulose-5-phosphate synthase
MHPLLDRIKSPADLKKFNPAELKELSSEIRELLYDTVSNTGGHLASNLGVVELTIALHRVFNSPTDKLVWDVGHQSYVHKLLTGRKEQFSSLRQYGGISGFTDMEESDHDVFGAGHASTAISASVGMAIARDLKGEKHNIVAIVGDGGLTGGMAYEALNHAGTLKKRIIVVLADNGMSISPTVGALSVRLNKIRLNYRVRAAKTKTKKVLGGSKLGDLVDWVMTRITRGTKALLMPTMLFEELGCTYIGPIDGHNIAEIETALEQVKNRVTKPAIIHVITTKGKGLKQAESAPVRFHSLPPKNGDNGDHKPIISYSRVFSQTLGKLMESDSRLVAITAAMSEGNLLENIAQKYPDRFFDVGICEEHAVTMAAGLATQGFIPVVAIYSTFLQRGFDQMIHDVCLQGLHVVFAVDRSGIVGEDGKTHQGIFDLSYLKLMPDMIVSAPKDENELQHLLFTAVRAKGPVAVRYPRGEGVGVNLDKELHEIRVGAAELIKPGTDVILLAIGSAVYPAIKASEDLEGKGISAGVVNARFAKPLDVQLIKEMALKTHRIVTIEENTIVSGFGSAVLEMINSENIKDVKVQVVGIPDLFVEHGSLELLRTKYNLDADGIVKSVIEGFPELIPAHSQKTV